MTKKDKSKKKAQKKKKDVGKIEKELEKTAKAETEEELRQKCKDLATIIEEMSSNMEEVPGANVENIIEPKLKEVEQKFTTQLQELKGGIESLEKKLERPVKGKGEGGDLVGKIEEKIEPRLTTLEEQMKALDKISELEETIKGITGEKEVKEGKEGKEIKKKLSILEDRIIQTMQEDLIEVKEAVENLYNSFDTMRDKTEKRIQQIQEALTPDTLKKLEDLISFLDKAVPSKVKEEVGDKFNTIFDQLNDLRENTLALETKMKKVLEEMGETRQTIKPIKEIKDDINKLQLEKDKLYKTIEDLKLKSTQMDNDLEFKFKIQIDELIKKFDDFDAVINNYLEAMEERANKLLSEFSKTKLQEIEKRYYTAVSSVQGSVENLNSELTKFEGMANSTFNSIKSGMEKLKFELEKFRKKEDEDFSKINQKMLANKLHLDKTMDALSHNIEEKLNKNIIQFREEIAEKSKTVELDLNQQFSDLTKTKLQEIENRYSDIFTPVEEKAKEMDLNLSKFKSSLTSNLNTIESKIEKLNVELRKFEDKNKDKYLKLDKRISDEKDLFEQKLKQYPDFIEDKVEKLFSELTESKISETEKKHSDVLHWVEQNINTLGSDLSNFKEFVNSNIKSLNAEDQTIKRNLNNLIEEASNVKSAKEDIKKTVSKKISEDFKDRLNSISSEISVLKGSLKEVSDRLKYFEIIDQKIAKLDSLRNRFLEEIEQQTAIINSIRETTKSELDKKFEADRTKYEDMLKNIMNEKRSLEEMMKRQREKISNYLRELKT